MSSASSVLEDLLATLESKASEAPAGGQDAVRIGDAISRELEAVPRVSAVRSVRDSQEMQAFRQALLDGLVRTDTVNRALRLVNEVLTRLL